MRRNLVLVLALGAVLAIGMATIANAVSITVRAGNLIGTFGGSVTPKAMPKNKFVPIKTNVFGKIKTSDGTHPSAVREVVVDIDKDTYINVKGLPICKPGQLEAQSSKAARKVCGKSTLGKGSASAEIAFAEQDPITVKSPLTVFNGGESGSKVKLLIHTFITVPVPASIVTKVTVQRKGTGVHSVAKIPRIVGGNGSAISFDFKLERKYTYKGKKRSYLMAKCPDGKFKVKVPKALFKNETRVPGVPAQTTLKGSLAVPCTPKG